MNSRRDFLKSGSAAALCGLAFFYGDGFAAENKGHTKYLDLPLGLELYSVRELLPKDYEGTLKQVAALGYQEVEAAGFYNRTPSQVKAAMRQAGLRCVSAHFSFDNLRNQIGEDIAFSRQIGLEYMICSGPGRKNLSRNQAFQGQDSAYTLDDWRWIAEQLNRFGEKVHAAGMKFGYHNHTREFKKENGIVPYDELMRSTDPSKVSMEMDCGWVIVGGGDPIELFRQYPTRISMLHVKDFKRIASPDPESDPPPAAELGQGVIDYRPIFAAAAQTGHIRHCFVEQEEFDMPAMQSLNIDADYMRKLRA